MLEWLNQHEVLLWWVGLGSLFTFVGTLVAIPVLVVRIPEDYFIRGRRPPPAWWSSRPLLGVVLRAAKNVLGLLLVLSGLILLFLPGQGLLTLLVGLLLLDFPGKYRLERRLACRRSVSRAMNWIRAKAGVPPIRINGER